MFKIDLLKHTQLIASTIQTDIRSIGLGPSIKEVDPLELFDRLITVPKIRQATRELYQNGYYALAVEECYKCLCNLVKNRSKLLGKSGKPLDGWDLMVQVFDEKNPILALNALKTESDENEQRGYRFIFAGVMAGIRNPRAHHHTYMDEADRALEMLAWGNHLAAKLKSAKKRNRKKAP